MLSQRLRELEQAGLLRRRKLAPPASARVYELTERGLALEPVVLELGRWGSEAPFPAGDAAFGADSFVIALKTLFDPAAADGLDVTVELRLGEDRFRSRVAGGRLDGRARERRGAGRDDRERPGALAAVLWHGRPLSEALRTGDVEIDGSTPAVKRFLGALPGAAVAGLEPRLALAGERERELPEPAAGRAVVGLRVGRRLGAAVEEVTGDALELRIDGEAHRRRRPRPRGGRPTARSPPAPSSSACRSRGAGSPPSPPSGSRRSASSKPVVICASLLCP